MSTYNSIGHMTAIFSAPDNSHANENHKPGVFAALRRWVAKTVGGARLHRELSSMSDHQLADIGVSRGDIQGLVNGTFVRHEGATVVNVSAPKQSETIKHIGEMPAQAA